MSRRVLLGGGALLLLNRESLGLSLQGPSSLDALRATGVTPDAHGAPTDGLSDSAPALRRAAVAAARGSKVLRLAASPAPYVIQSELVIPDGLTVLIENEVIGHLETSRISMASSIMIFDGGRFENCQLLLTGGSPQVHGFNYRGRNLTAALLIQGSGTYRDVVIDGLDIRGANYGLLRNGAASTLAGCRVTNGYFADLAGDAIQFDRCAQDSGVIVDGHVIDGIDSGGRNRFWGIGVGFAGTGMDPRYPDALMMKGFVVRNITGRRLRQLVHVEMGKDFEIANVVGEQIEPVYSQGADLDCATVVCYGSTAFTIDTVRNHASHRDAGVKVLGAAGGNQWLSPSSDFTIRDIVLDNGSLSIEPGAGRDILGQERPSYVRASDCTLRDGAFEVTGRAGEMRFDRITARRARALGPAILLRTSGVGDTRDRFLAHRGRLSLTSVDGRDERGAASASLAVGGLEILDGRGNGFALPSNAE